MSSATARSPSLPLAGVRIVLAEDHESPREALRQLLEYFGASVEAADSGAAALEALARSTTAPDVILADIRMPGMDGLELAHRLAQEPRWRDIPRVAVTANTSMAALRATLEAGYRAHIGKPIDPDVLVVTLQRVSVAKRRPPAAPGGPDDAPADEAGSAPDRRKPAVGPRSARAQSGRVVSCALPPGPPLRVHPRSRDRGDSFTGSRPRRGLVERHGRVC